VWKCRGPAEWIAYRESRNQSHDPLLSQKPARVLAAIASGPHR
jgi:hypothetical protein